jgi:formate dehydrogenase major subunit
VVQDITAGEYAEFAEAVLPAAAFLERDGHFTDWEGRGQRLRPIRAPAGLARPDWQIFQELSEVAGADMGFGSLEDLHGEMGRLLAPREVAEPALATGGVDQATPEEAAGSPDERAIPQAHEPTGGEEESSTEETTAPEQADRAMPERGSGSDDAEERGEGLLLFSYPLLVDEGRLSVDAEELKAALEEEPFLEVHPDDASRLGLGDGDRARLRTEAGEAEIAVRVTDGIVAGAAFVPWNQPGLRASTLFRRGARTSATLEPVTQPQEATA